MNPDATRRTLLAALALLALVALVVHTLVHPVLAADRAHAGQTVLRGSFVSASLMPLADLVLVTPLFAWRRTAPLAYLLNGMLVVYGTVLMAHFGIAALVSDASARNNWVLRSMLHDIALAWVDFLVGKALYESWLREA